MLQVVIISLPFFFLRVSTILNGLALLLQKYKVCIKRARCGPGALRVSVVSVHF